MANRINDQELDAILSNQAPAWVRQSSTASAVSNTVSNNSSANSAPAKAPAAPGKSKDVFTGLCEALNAFQRRLADPKDPNRKYDIPDEYEIEFAPVEIGAATLKRQGTLDKSKTPLQQKTPQALKPETNSVNNNGRIVSVSAGMQIVQFIDQVMRNSSYITDQQLYVVDSKTQKAVPNPNPPNGVTAWYKISVEADQLGFDNRRKDHAYRMKFVISPYAINSLPSDWFRNSRYRGSHKSYNYWFTGANNEILNFEQEYNYLYRLIISGLNVPLKQRQTDFRDVYRRTFLPTSENHAKGADGYENEPGDNGASFLYSPSDQGTVKIRIVGDPGWMQQGEVSVGVNVQDFNFAPFASDGTINYDSQEIVFDISFNQPQDYDLNTGLMDLARTGIKEDGTYSTQPQFNFTYTAVTCKSFFSKGRFEQEIEGRLLTEFDQKTDANPANRDVGRAQAQNPPPAAGTRTADNGTTTENPWVDVNGLQVLGTDVTPEGGTNQEDSAPQLLNSPPPEEPTSSGSIQPVDPASANYTVPPPIGTLRLNNGRVATFLEPDRASYERALASGATPVNSEPQKTNRET